MGKTVSSRKEIDGIWHKTCTKCGVFRPVTAEYFHRYHAVRDGLTSHCKTCVASYSRSPKGIEKSRRSKLKRKDAAKTQNKLWRSRPDVRARRNERERNRRGNDSFFAISNRMRCLMWQGLKNLKGGQKWSELVPYTIEQLKRHLEKNFTEGMTWELFLAGEIHIDHKIPLTAFNYKSPMDDDFQKCWSLKNLQPLWGSENWSKGDKLEKPYQPSLLIGRV
jgi:hypothetical protein